jgi:hypothetical protein
MKKYLFFLIILFSFYSIAGILPAEKARGLFISFGAGPRLPIGNFANNSTLGYGLNAEISYTDNDYLPVFLFLRAGYQQFAGSQDFYKVTDYSNFSTSAIPLNLGVRYYFPPLLQNVVLLMPVVEISATCSFFQKLNEFKPISGRDNYTEKSTKLGVSAGVGVSMFLLEILANYTYYQTNQYVGLDLRVRLPLFISY